MLERDGKVVEKIEEEAETIKIEVVEAKVMKMTGTEEEAAAE